MPEDDAVVVKNLSKSFMLPHEKRDTLKSFFVNPFNKTEVEKQVAFKNLNFEIKKGEFFGIVGRNGSGKSTLLKRIAGVYTPNQGAVTVNGTLVPFIELGVGFNPELTGRDNVFLNGSLLGFSRSEMADMYEDIVEFAELEKYMDQKLKNYSSGMQVRLAFSIAIRARGDILLLDEVLAVGDSSFQQKCFDYFHSLKEQKKTIILVSHSMQAVEQFCDRALLLEQGRIKKIGGSGEIAALYETMFLREEASKTNLANESKTDGDVIKVDELKIEQNSKITENIKAYEPFIIRLQITPKKDYPQTNIGINIKNKDRIMVLSTDTKSRLSEKISLEQGRSVVVSFEVDNVYTDGVYTVSLGLADCSEERDKLLYKEEGVCTFYINGIQSNKKSLTHPKISVKVDK